MARCPQAGRWRRVCCSGWRISRGEGSYADAAEAALGSVQGLMRQAPLGFAHWLSVLEFALAPPREVAIIGEEPGQLLATVRARYRPDLVVAAGPADDASVVELLRRRAAVGGRATAYVCRQFACENPVTEPSELERLLD